MVCSRKLMNSLFSAMLRLLLSFSPTVASFMNSAAPPSKLYLLPISMNSLWFLKLRQIYVSINYFLVKAFVIWNSVKVSIACQLLLQSILAFIREIKELFSSLTTFLSFNWINSRFSSLNLYKKFSDICTVDMSLIKFIHRVFEVIFALLNL